MKIGCYVDLAGIDYWKGAYADTDMAFSKAVTALETLLETGPPGSRSPGEGLTQALREYAVFKRIRGEGAETHPPGRRS